MEDLPENGVEIDLMSSSVSQKRLRLLAAQLHDLKMGWNDLDSSLLQQNTVSPVRASFVRVISDDNAVFRKQINLLPY